MRILILISFSLWGIGIGGNGIFAQEVVDPELDSSQIQEKNTARYQHPIPFAPEQYVCYRATDPLVLDGKLTESSWESAAWTKDFVDIEGNLKPLPAHRTRVKMLWDDQYFYFGAVLEEPHVWATLRQRDTIVFHNDDFEVFIDPDGDGHGYYEVEVNALNTVWDLLMLWPYHLRRGPNNVVNWNNPGLMSAVHLEGTLNHSQDIDQYWSVEIAFPWKALMELAPGKIRPNAGDQWRVNFSRVDWPVDIRPEGYLKRMNPETGKPHGPDNWVWSPTGRIDMHRPETWGYVQFSDQPVTTSQDSFVSHPDEAIKWALWQLFYQQRAYREQFGRYTADLSVFTLPEVPGQVFRPKAFAGADTFEFLASSMGEGAWHIDHTGKIWKK